MALINLKINAAYRACFCCLLAVFSGCNKDEAPDHPLIDGATIGSPAHFPADYNDEYTIKKVSGDNQIGIPGVQLAEPFKIQITNIEGNPVQGIPVWFGWSYEPESYDTTDANGFAVSHFTPSAYFYYSESNNFTFTVEVRPETDYRSVIVKGLPIAFTYSFNVVAVAGANDFGAGSNQLQSAKGIFTDAAGNLYIADSENSRVQKWSPGANYGQTVAGGNGYGSAGNQLSRPEDVWVDAAGNVFVADRYNHRIQKWAPGASSGVEVANGNGLVVQFNPISLFGDNNGNLYVISDYTHEVVKFNQGSATGVRVAGGNFSGNPDQIFHSPEGVFVDNSGNIYVADTENHRVHKWAPGATVGITVAGGNGEGSEPNQLDNPVDVWVDAAANIYVSDQGRGITKWREGEPYGQKVAGGSGPISLDAAGNIYISAGHQVFKWKQ